MARKALGVLLLAIGIAWLVAYSAITHTDANGNRVDMLGHPYPKDVFSYRARKRLTHPKHFDRFKYLHFYVSWGGFGVPAAAGLALIKGKWQLKE